MDADTKERLIEIVRKNKCIYEPSDKNYKNVTYKTLLWQNIGRELNIKADLAKKLWRCLRDGYMRYKRLKKQPIGPGKKAIQYAWSKPLSFLDGLFESASTDPDNSDDDDDTCSENGLISPPPAQPSPEPKEESSWKAELFETEQLSPSTPQPNTASNRRTNPNSEMDECYHTKKRKKSLDGTDHLFMSYAYTFKQLPLTLQAKLKVDLAKLFADAELDVGAELRRNQPVVASCKCAIPQNDSVSNIRISKVNSTVKF